CARNNWAYYAMDYW
nr:immunoglobulin heavy chain junction region [Mus musculus]MBK4185870.1 immunoglobulin heavy chain junction region [Mus musculus]